MTDKKEFPPEVIEAAVLANISFYAVSEFRDAHEAVVKFMEKLSKDGGINLKEFEFIMGNVLLTLLHGRDYMRLATAKLIDPLNTEEEKAKWESQKEAILEVAKEDDRIIRLAVLVKEDLKSFEHRVEEEAIARADKIAQAFEAFLKGSDEASTD